MRIVGMTMLFSGLYILAVRSGALTALLVLAGAIALGCVLVLWLGASEQERKSRAALKAAARRASGKVRRLVARREQAQCRAELEPPDFGTEDDDDAAEEPPV